MVAVKNRYQLTVDLGQGMVQVAGLGVAVVGPGDIVDARFLGELFEAWTVAVIEQVNAQLVLGPVDTQRGIHRAAGHRELFVVGRYQQVDRRPQAGIAWQLRRLAIERPGGLNVAQNQHQPGIGFCQQQNKAAYQIQGVVPVQGRGVAPPQVAARDDH